MVKIPKIGTKSLPMYDVSSLLVRNNVLTVKIVIEVKMSDGSWGFVFGDVFALISVVFVFLFGSFLQSKIIFSKDRRCWGIPSFLEKEAFAALHKLTKQAKFYRLTTPVPWTSGHPKLDKPVIDISSTTVGKMFEMSGYWTTRHDIDKLFSRVTSSKSHFLGVFFFDPNCNIECSSVNSLLLLCCPWWPCSPSCTPLSFSSLPCLPAKCSLQLTSRWVKGECPNVLNMFLFFCICVFTGIWASARGVLPKIHSATSYLAWS